MFAKDVMSDDVVTVKLETKVKDVVELLHSSGLHELPVINDLGNPLGVVTARSILHFSLPSYAGGNLLNLMKGGPDIESVYANLKQIQDYDIQSVVNKDIEKVDIDTPTSAVAAVLMSQHGDANNVLVVEDGVLVGIISARDILCRSLTV